MKKTILVVIGILVISGLAYFGFNKFFSNDSSSSSKELANSDDEYLVISEWGVKIPVDESVVKDIEYKIREGGVLVNFGSKKLTTYEVLCSSNEIGIGIGLTRQRSDELSENQPIKEVDGYNFSISPSSVTCNQNNVLSEEDQKYLSELKDALLNGLIDVEKIN